MRCLSFVTDRFLIQELYEKNQSERAQAVSKEKKKKVSTSMRAAVCVRARVCVLVSSNAVHTKHASGFTVVYQCSMLNKKDS